MPKITEIYNENFKYINFMYYVGKRKREILKGKEKVIKKMQKDKILGLGYTINYMQTYNGKSMNDVTYAEGICEYIFTQPSEMEILCISLGDIVFEDEYKLEREKYKSDLEGLGYIELPPDFRNMEPNDLVDLFKFSKNKTMEK